MLQGNQNEHGCESAAGFAVRLGSLSTDPSARYRRFQQNSSKGKDGAGREPCSRGIGFSKYILLHRKTQYPHENGWRPRRGITVIPMSACNLSCVVWGCHSAPSHWHQASRCKKPHTAYRLAKLVLVQSNQYPQYHDCPVCGRGSQNVAVLGSTTSRKDCLGEQHSDHQGWYSNGSRQKNPTLPLQLL